MSGIELCLSPKERSKNHIISLSLSPPLFGGGFKVVTDSLWTIQRGGSTWFACCLPHRLESKNAYQRMIRFEIPLLRRSAKVMCESVGESR